MATVGINFGSATSGTGFDVASTVTAIQAAESAIETPWNTELTALSAQNSALSTIGTDLSTLTTSLQALTDFTGVTAQKNGSSSDTTQLDLTGATSTAVAGSHTVVINNLATTSSKYSTVVGSTDTLAGSITIQVGSGTAQTVTVGSSSNTLSTLSAAINSAAIGVSASVITDSTGSRLSLVSGTGGSSGNLTVTSTLTDTTTSGSAVTFTTGSTGANASLTVDGIAVSNATNTVSTAIPGVTFQLLSADPNVPVQIQITNDTTDVASAFSTLVTSYNAVVKDLKTQEGNDSSGNAEPLYGSTTLSLIQSQLSQAIFGGAASGAISSVTQLGITFNNDGTLALNTDTLTTALTNHFTDVVGYLQNSGSFGQSFATTLNGLGTQAPDGAIYTAQQQISTQETALNADITNENAILATQKTALTAELNTANQELQAIPEQLNEINEIYSAVTGYNTNTGT
jgi:flagellar hook-associated protein 2